MKKSEKVADFADYGGEQASSGLSAERLGPQRAPADRESRRKAPWRFRPIMSQRTSEFAAAILEDIREIVREEVRAAHQALLQEITESAREQSTAITNPDEQLTVEQAAEAMHVIPATVRMWIRQGNLRASRPPGASGGPGRVYRIARADLKEFIEATQRNVQPGGSEADLRAEAARIVAIDVHRRRT
ncbi:MAG TPA: helix-turn-helix domain-containing protein [Candidatus Acidoferrum sp.]|nr:helix-turn-helix domain-containing protein [Candidatus Acidoferrum sp.]